MASGPRRSVSRAVSGAPASEPTTRTPRTCRSASAPARSSTGREEDPMDAGRFRASEQCAEVLRVLERIKHEDERRFAPLTGAAKDVRHRRELPRFDDHGDPLMSVEAGDRGERAALDLHDRDPQPRGVEHELLERRPPLRYDEQAMGDAAGREHLLDGSAAGDELLVRAEHVGWLEAGWGRPGCAPERCSGRRARTRWVAVALPERRRPGLAGTRVARPRWARSGRTRTGRTGSG